MNFIVAISGALSRHLQTWRFGFGARRRQSPAPVTNLAQEELAHHSSPISMFLETTPGFPIQNLCVWNEKLGSECTQIREIPPLTQLPSTSLESKVSMRRPIPVPMDSAAGIPWYTSSGLHRSAISRLIISLWNTLRPVNGLPPEALSFTYRLSRLRRFRRRHEAIIPLTRVCRYWGESIISIPENWTMVFSHRRNFVALSLERAKAAPQ